MKGGYIIKDISLLKEKFDIIYKKGWIKAICGGHGAIGLTFESELNKDLDSNYFPDFYGLEIKCTSRFSKYPYSLFISLKIFTRDGGFFTKDGTEKASPIAWFSS